MRKLICLGLSLSFGLCVAHGQRASDVEGSRPAAKAARAAVAPAPLADPLNGGAATVCPSGLQSFSGMNSQMGRVFRDAIPSSCPSKAYPGIFNPGTPYFYETYTYSNSTAAASCVTVAFDPNPNNNLATDCDTNAHASAYIGSYDPMNQSANFVGDVGSSITDSFSFEVPAMSDLVLVVTNTSAEEVCDFAFSLTAGDLDCPNPVTLPTFSKSFSPNPAPTFSPVTLTFTIDNSANGLDAQAVNFTDSLPAGMTVANPANENTTCTGGTITAAPGSSQVSYNGGTVGASSTCEVTVEVVADTAGDIVNTSGDLTTAFGNSGPAQQTLNVSLNYAEVPALNTWGYLLLGGLLVLVAWWRLSS